MIIVTSEYIFLNPKLNEMNDFKNNTLLEHNRKNGDNHCRKIEFNFNNKIFDKIKKQNKKYYY